MLPGGARGEPDVVVRVHEPTGGGRRAGAGRCSGCTGAGTCWASARRTTRCWHEVVARTGCVGASPSSGAGPPRTRTRPRVARLLRRAALAGRRRRASTPAPLVVGGASSGGGARRRPRPPGPRPGRGAGRRAAARLPDARRPRGTVSSRDGRPTRGSGTTRVNRPGVGGATSSRPRRRTTCRPTPRRPGPPTSRACRPPGSRRPSWTSSSTRTSSTPPGLLAAGVPTELHVYPGGVHGFDLFAPEAAVTRRFCRDRDEAFDRFLGCAGRVRGCRATSPARSLDNACQRSRHMVTVTHANHAHDYQSLKESE